MRRCNRHINENSEVKGVSPESDTKLREELNLEDADTINLVASNTSSAQMTSAISTSRSLRLHRAVQQQKVSQACNQWLLPMGFTLCQRVSESDNKTELKRGLITRDGDRYGQWQSIAERRLITAERRSPREITPERGTIAIIQGMNKL